MPLAPTRRMWQKGGLIRAEQGGRRDFVTAGAESVAIARPVHIHWSDHTP